MHESLRPLLGSILLFIWGLMLVNGVVFRHAHKLKDGRIISHAHPYKATNSPYQPNNHTDNELLLIDTVSNAIFTSLVTVVLGFVALRPVAVLASVIVTHFWVNLYKFSSQLSFHLRGPPAGFC